MRHISSLVLPHTFLYEILACYFLKRSLIIEHGIYIASQNTSRHVSSGIPLLKLSFTDKFN